MTPTGFPARTTGKVLISAAFLKRTAISLCERIGRHETDAPRNVTGLHCPTTRPLLRYGNDVSGNY